ncbi:MAG: ABC transporter substrate-binding protein [Beijerinckiaceae bacterium]|jgi:NitT/TauT family transport system substrate-binding protein|nr:ABC transporter substrate-binding protein [Beijerinckiaceae bacterium]
MFARINRRLAVTGAVLLAAQLFAAPQVLAQDKMKIAAGQRGNWDTSVSEVGSRAGIFKKHGLELEILYTQGSGETQQAVISGAVDVGVAIGTLGAMSAFAKGAPIRIIGAESTGAQDLFWYVREDSPIKSLTDTEGRTISYSTAGSSTQGIVNAFISEKGLKAKPVATGSPPSSLTQVMSGQVDIGWAAPPFGIEMLDQKKIRLLASGNDTSFKDQTVRVLATNVNALTNRKDVITRYMQAYRETIDYMYTNPEALKVYSDWLKITPELAQRSRDGFFPRSAIDPDRIIGLDKIAKDAIAFKYLTTPLTKEQLAELIQIPPAKK